MTFFTITILTSERVFAQAFTITGPAQVIESAGAVQFTVKLNIVPQSGAQVNYNIVMPFQLTATSSTSGTLQFSGASDTVKTLTVTFNDNTTGTTSSQIVTANLSSAVNAGIAVSSAQVNVQDDDLPSQVTVPFFNQDFGTKSFGQSDSTKAFKIINNGNKPGSPPLTLTFRKIGDPFFTVTLADGSPLPKTLSLALGDTVDARVTFSPPDRRINGRVGLVFDFIQTAPINRVQTLRFIANLTDGNPIVNAIDFGTIMVQPLGLTMHNDTLYVVNKAVGDQIRKFSKNGGSTSSVVSLGSFNSLKGFIAGLVASNNRLYFTDTEDFTGRGRIVTVPVTGGNATELNMGAFSFSFPAGLTISPDGQTLYAGVFEENPFFFKPNARILKVGIDGSDPSFLNLGSSKLGFITDLKISEDGQTLFISDAGTSSLNVSALEGDVIAPFDSAGTFTGARLVKVPVAGGDVTVISKGFIPGGMAVKGDSLFVGVAGGFLKIPVTGGQPVLLQLESLGVQPFGIVMDGGTPLLMDSNITRRLLRLVKQVPDLETKLRAPGGSSSILLQMARRFYGPGIVDARLPVTLTTDEEVGVRDLQFHVAHDPTTGNIRLDAYQASDRFVPSSALDSLEYNVEVSSPTDDTLSVVITPAGNQTIPANRTIPLGELRFDVKPAPSSLPSPPARVVLGTSRLVKILEDAFLEATDVDGNEMDVEIVNGGIRVGIRGDVNLDGKINVLDVVFLVNQILERVGFDRLPDADTVDHDVRDVNEDGNPIIGVTDVVAIIRKLLRRESSGTPSGKEIVSEPAIVSLGTPFVQADGQQVTPLIVESGALAGLHAVLTFDPQLITLGTAQIVGPAEHILVESEIKNGRMNLLILNLQGQSLIPGDHRMLALIPATLVGDKPGVLTLETISASDTQARTALAQIREATQGVSGREATLPTSFALREARPNPFNPTTTIAYDVPQKAHIRLTVYNLLGQEVVRLVNQVQLPGRYEVMWNAFNSKGQPVASGIYLYRMTSDAGFSDSKRMVLLK